MPKTQTNPKSRIQNSPLLRALSLLILSAALILANKVQAQSPLANHPSEYLAMHAKDPVDWHLFTPQTLNKARQLNKPILISSGYFSCHWCHVTQAEIYQDPQMAAQLNQEFINIKLDRELNPEIDRGMIDFAKEVVGSAGWPQHVIYTPDLLPIAAFTYLPKAELSVYLQRFETVWTQNAKQLQHLASQYRTTKSINQTNQETHFSADSLPAGILQSLTENLDDFSGGLQGSHKFPNAPLLLSLLKQPHLSTELNDWLKLTLERIQSEHLQDHIYGGFYRYTIDPEWQIPHFEKMLYDNAQLLQIYVLAGLKWQNTDFLQTAERTLTYLQEQLYKPSLNLYLGSQSALDKTGEEGGDYLWTKQALHTVLSTALFTEVETAWQLQRPARYQLRTGEAWHPKPTDKHWQEIRTKLAQRKQSQTIPTDSKAILAWNGLMLSALTEVSKHKEKLPAGDFPQLAQANTLAELLANRLSNLFMQSSVPRALAWQESPTPLLQATLEDYSYTLSALQSWHSLQPSERNQNAIKAIKHQLATQFLTPNGWKFSHDAHSAHWHIADNELPSPTAYVNCLFSTQMPPAGKNPALLDKALWRYASYLSNLDCANAQISLQ